VRVTEQSGAFARCIGQQRSGRSTRILHPARNCP
jgi:hypothetical protein